MTTDVSGEHASNWLLRWAIGTFIVVLVLFGAFATYHFMPEQSVQNGLQAIRDQGMPATWEDLVAFYPERTGTDTAAMAPIPDSSFSAEWNAIVEQPLKPCSKGLSSFSRSPRRHL